MSSPAFIFDDHLYLCLSKISRCLSGWEFYFLSSDAHCSYDTDQAARKMRDSIANGELDGQHSYVTRWDAEAKCV